jgi:hypothetical protein
VGKLIRPDLRGGETQSNKQEQETNIEGA